MNDLRDLEINWVQNIDKIMIIELNLTKRRGWEIIIKDNKLVLIYKSTAIPMVLYDYVDDKKVSINYEYEKTQINFETKKLWPKLFLNDKENQNESEIKKINSILN